MRIRVSTLKITYLFEALATIILAYWCIRLAMWIPAYHYSSSSHVDYFPQPTPVDKLFAEKDGKILTFNRNSMRVVKSSNSDDYFLIFDEDLGLPNPTQTPESYTDGMLDPPYIMP